MSKRRRPAGSAPAKPPKPREVYVTRAFQGLPGEPDWIALRELVPAASAPLALAGEFAQRYGDRPVLLATVLPGAVPAMSRVDGQVLLALQRHVQSGDVSRDLAVALECALAVEPGQPVAVPALPGPGPRLQDVLDPRPLDVTVHEGFEFWLEDPAAADAAVTATLQQANASIFPTVRLAAAPAAYWCRVPDKSHLRWVLPQTEDEALAGLARLAALGDLGLGEGTRFAGMFRAHGLLIPVWDLPRPVPGPDWEEPLAAFAKRYDEAVASTEPLTAAQRRARQGLIGRQLTLR